MVCSVAFKLEIQLQWDLQIYTYVSYNTFLYFLNTYVIFTYQNYT